MISGPVVESESTQTKMWSYSNSVASISEGGGERTTSGVFPLKSPIAMRNPSSLSSSPYETFRAPISSSDISPIKSSDVSMDRDIEDGDVEESDDLESTNVGYLVQKIQLLRSQVIKERKQRHALRNKYKELSKSKDELLQQVQVSSI
jgi:hypothetical protein